jgi:predicted transcriptional regulator
MTRKLKLSPIQRDILVMLEEAGSETIGTVKATLKVSEEELVPQVDGLVALGLVRKDGNEVVLTDAGRKAFRS